MKKYKIQRLWSIEDLNKHWEFFKLGLREMADPRRANLLIPDEVLYKVCLRSLEDGYVFIARSGVNGKISGYGVGLDNTPAWEEKKVFLIYAVYIPGDDPELSSQMLEECEEMARKDEFDLVETFARRFTGAATRYYNKKHGFFQSAIVFRKSLTKV